MRSSMNKSNYFLSKRKNFITKNKKEKNNAYFGERKNYMPKKENLSRPISSFELCKKGK